MQRMIIALVISLAASLAIIVTAAKATPGGPCVHDPVAGTFCGGTPADTSDRPK